MPNELKNEIINFSSILLVGQRLTTNRSDVIIDLKIPKLYSFFIIPVSNIFFVRKLWTEIFFSSRKFVLVGTKSVNFFFFLSCLVYCE